MGIFIGGVSVTPSTNPNDVPVSFPLVQMAVQDTIPFPVALENDGDYQAYVKNNIPDIPYYYDVTQNYNYSLTPQTSFSTTDFDTSTGDTSDTLTDITGNVSMVIVPVIPPGRNTYFFLWDTETLPDGLTDVIGTYQTAGGSIVPFAKTFQPASSTHSYLSRVLYNPYCDQLEFRVMAQNAIGASNPTIEAVIGGKVYTLQRTVGTGLYWQQGEVKYTVVVDGPFANPFGPVKIRDSWDLLQDDGVTPIRWHGSWIEYDLAPFVGFEDTHIDGLRFTDVLGNGVINEQLYGNNPYFNINGFIDTSKSFGFKTKATTVQFGEGGVYLAPSLFYMDGLVMNEIFVPGVAPPMPLLADVGDVTYLPEWFPRDEYYPFFTYLNAVAMDDDGNNGLSDHIHLECLRILPSIRGDYTANTQVLNNSFHLDYQTDANKRNVYAPPVYTATITPNKAGDLLPEVITHYKIALEGNELTDYAYPSTVFLPDHTRRLLALNRAAKQYELFATSNTQGEGGFMSIAWPSGYYAANLTLLIDGTLLSTAWTYSKETADYSLWVKASYDGGTTWQPEILINTYVSPPYPPSYPVVQNFRTGIIYAGPFENGNMNASGDMGRTWGDGN